MSDARRRLRDEVADDTIKVCPACGSSAITYRPTMDPPWACEAGDCGERFDDPREREREHQGSIGGMPDHIKEALKASGLDYAGLAGD